jgi:hypothetical protein
LSRRATEGCRFAEDEAGQQQIDDLIAFLLALK